MQSSEAKQGLKTFIITSLVTLGVIFSLNGVSNYYNKRLSVDEENTNLERQTTYSKISTTSDSAPVTTKKPPKNVFANLSNPQGIVLAEATDSTTPVATTEASPAATPDTGITIYSLMVIIASVVALFFGFILLKEMPFRKGLIEKFEEEVVNNHK